MSAVKAAKLKRFLGQQSGLHVIICGIYGAEFGASVEPKAVSRDNSRPIAGVIDSSSPFAQLPPNNQ